MIIVQVLVNWKSKYLICVCTNGGGVSTVIIASSHNDISERLRVNDTDLMNTNEFQEQYWRDRDCPVEYRWVWVQRPRDRRWALDWAAGGKRSDRRWPPLAPPAATQGATQCSRPCSRFGCAWLTEVAAPGAAFKYFTTGGRKSFFV